MATQQPPEVRAFDVLVIGAGVAGMTAALFVARHGYSCLVLAGFGVGGALLTTERVEDYPGFPDPVAGYDLAPMLEDQARANGVEFHRDDATSVRPFMGSWLVMSESGGFRASAVVVATGRQPVGLPVPGFVEFQGRGISHCAGCDGPLFAGRPVAVVGGGDSALQEALVLAEHVSAVHLYVRDEILRGQATYATRVRASSLITVHYEHAVEEILGDDVVRTVRVRDLRSEEVTEEEVASVFAYIGGRSCLGFLGDLGSRDEEGALLVDSLMCTDVKGLYAAGEVRSGSVGQAAASLGDGATAGVAVSRYLRDRAGLA